MKKTDALEKYNSFTGEKSGFITQSGKLIYLYNNACCEAKCRRVLLRSERENILADYFGDLIITRCGANFEVYCNSRRLLGVSECVILYEVVLSENSLCGAFTGGKELLLADSHFTDPRVLKLIDRLIVGESAAEPVLGERFKELEEAVRIGEVKALNEIYLKYGGQL